MPAVKPWEFHPDLTQDRLVAVAQLIASGRDAALEIYDPVRGFNGWLLGCCAYQFGRVRIQRAVEEQSLPWLGISRGTRHFIFQIGAVPVRFYRDDPDDPSEKVLQQSEFEVQAALPHPRRRGQRSGQLPPDRADRPRWRADPHRLSGAA